MTDIVELLREFSGPRYPDDICGKACMGEAADEITRLRADLLKAEMRAEIAGLENILRAVAKGRREGIEAALVAVDAEPEPEGEMPSKLANTDARILVMATVRATKRGIGGRICSLLENKK